MLKRAFFIVRFVTALAWGVTVLAGSIPGELAYQAGDFEQARIEVSAALVGDEDPMLKLMLARISMAENNLTGAEDIISGVLRSEPDNALAHSLKGELYAIKTSRAGFFNMGKLARQALSAYETALKYDPQHVDALTGMIRFRMSAPALFGGSVKKAMAAAEQLSAIDPVAGALETAEIYRTQNDDERHVALLQKLTLSHPEDPRAWLALGFERQRERDWISANDHFVTALAASEALPLRAITAQSARYQIGRTAVLSGKNTKDGIAALNRYLEGPRFGELPDVHWAHYRRGLLHRQQQNEKEAQRDFEFAAGTSDQNLKRALSSL